jgi:hypothetical protein
MAVVPTTPEPLQEQSLKCAVLEKVVVLTQLAPCYLATETVRDLALGLVLDSKSQE